MATASDSIDSLKDELRSLGEKRKQRAEDDAQLASEIEGVLKRAYGKVSVSEAAKLLDMHRTTVYRVYHPHNG